MIKRVLWFVFLGALVFVFIRSFPWNDPSRAVDWLVETSFIVRGYIESLTDWLFSFLPEPTVTPATEPASSE